MTRHSTALGILQAALAVLAAVPAAAQTEPFRIEVEQVLDADGVHAGGSIRAAVRFTIPGQYHVQSNQPLDEFTVPTELTLAPPAGITVGRILYPDHVMFKVAGETMAVFEQTFVIGVELNVADGVAPGVHRVPATLAYQACDSRVCLMPASLDLSIEVPVVPASAEVARVEPPLFAGLDFPARAAATPPPPATGTAETPPPPAGPVTPTQDCDVLSELDGFEVLGVTGGYLGVEDFVAFVDGAEAGTLQPDFFAGKAPLVILLLVLVGGVLLNLTPCVLPLIPINLAIIGAGAQAGSRKRGFALGGTYGLAMALVYGGLGLLVILTSATFGAINSTIWFNVAIAILFVFLALAMFDVIVIDFSKYQGKLDLAGKSRQAGKGTFLLAFGMGGVAALLAGACVAPVVIHVIVYASDQYAKGVTIALALPLVLGLGMALPWPFAGAGLSFLPKPGPWMVRVKQAMGLFILAFAAYYGWTAWTIYDARPADGGHVAGGWTDSICGGLAAARAEDRPVLIDMWATWCKNCLAMDKTTFDERAVLDRLDDYVKIKYQAEDLTASPSAEMLRRFGGIGLPVYAILRPRTGSDA
jgi:thiol:disulfide interchange protein DsbD